MSDRCRKQPRLTLEALTATTTTKPTTNNNNGLVQKGFQKLTPADKLPVALGEGELSDRCRKQPRLTLGALTATTTTKPTTDNNNGLVQKGFQRLTLADKAASGTRRRRVVRPVPKTTPADARGLNGHDNNKANHKQQQPPRLRLGALAASAARATADVGFQTARNPGVACCGSNRRGPQAGRLHAAGSVGLLCYTWIHRVPEEIRFSCIRQRPWPCAAGPWHSGGCGLAASADEVKLLLPWAGTAASMSGYLAARWRTWPGRRDLGLPWRMALFSRSNSGQRVPLPRWALAIE